MEHVYSSLTQRAVTVYKKSVGDAGQCRIIIAFAGPPGSGKSTIADQVVQRINTLFRRPLAACLAMDGFHYPRAYLDSLPNHIEAHTCRGAAWTFDAGGLEGRGACRDPCPSFDHKIKDPVPDAIWIEVEIKIIITEGNWVLLDRDPWRQIQECVDDTWFVDVDPELALHRIARRHLAAGIENTWAAAVARAESNDLRNGAEVRAHLLEPNVWVKSVEIINT
ncbi:P-loop containing nucleoside triphosphate hydrolase protein [Xylaria palmicola]|nr:P-loop containing nucleoside triphosphate hydrolase protein [Xylaria palmicola]